MVSPGSGVAINGLLLRGERLVIPKKLQKKIVDAAHEGHQGITKTKSLLRSRVWFPGMDAIVERTVRDCMACQVATPQTSRMPLKMTPLPAVKTDEIGAKDPDMKPYTSLISELSVINGLLLRGERLVIPKKLQKKIVDAVHEGHQGITKTKSLLRSRVWFPGMDAIVERTVRDCMACQVATPQTSRMPLKMTPLPGETMEEIAADLVP